MAITDFVNSGSLLRKASLNELDNLACDVSPAVLVKFLNDGINDGVFTDEFLSGVLFASAFFGVPLSTFIISDGTVFLRRAPFNNGGDIND